jgi:hypothetical protein
MPPERVLVASKADRKIHTGAVDEHAGLVHD